ncbi:MAG: TonB-dependent receptor [Acidobacteria bacterium]|nr:TonB-dependent receptor [Acidobacteriota bacterium]
MFQADELDVNIGYLFLFAFCTGAHAEPADGDLRGLSLEQLLSLEVTSVRKKEQRLDRAAAAVYVITQEDIRRAGITSIPEALRLAPGLHVARINGGTWAISARGFNDAFSNKLLVLMDGRSVYTPLYSGVWWHTVDTLIDDIDRIEVIRGPAAAMWGANAVNGVINIITRRADQTEGTLASISAGSDDHTIARFRHGAALGKSASYRIYAQNSLRNQWPPEESPEDAHWGVGQGGFRVDWRRSDHQELTVQGDLNAVYGQAFEQDSYPAPLPGSLLRNTTDSGGANVLTRWSVVHRSGSETHIQGYMDYLDNATNGLDAHEKTADVDIHHRMPFRRNHELVLGAGYRSIWDWTEGNAFSHLVPAGMHHGIGSMTAVDEIELIPGKLTATLGTRIEHNSFSGWNAQPTARLLWSQARNHTLWGSISRAVRTPSRADIGVVRIWPRSGIAVTGNPDLRNETLNAYEIGYRTQFRKRVAIDLAAFRNGYGNLRSTELIAPPPGQPRFFYWTRLDNLARAESYGTEGVVTLDISARWRMSASYTGLWMKMGRQAGLGGSIGQPGLTTPRHQWQAHSSWNLPRRTQFDAHLYHYGGMPGGGLPPARELSRGYTRADVRLGWRVSEAGEFSLAGQNLLDSRHVEFFYEPGPALAEIRRSYYAKFTWRF